MVVQLLPKTQTSPVITWELLPKDYILPDDPVENIQQPKLAAALLDALGEADRVQPDMLIGSNFALVATVDKTTIVKAPDWFYIPHVHAIAPEHIRRSYTPHTEGDPVAVVMEFLSAEDNGELSVRSTPPYGKLHFYEQILKVPTYVTYDPYGPSLHVRCLEGDHYVLQQPNENGRFWIVELQLFLGIWEGDRLGQRAHWLRWWDSSGNLLLWSSEQVVQERQIAEQERQIAEQERQIAQQERERSSLLAAKLRELGLDPDQIS
jgi:Uma2 family endonuclease